MIEIIKADGRAEGERIDAMRARAAQVGAGIQRAVSAVMEDVKARGYEAVKEYSLRFDGTEPYELSQADLTAACDRCPKDLIAALEHAAANIRDYNEKLLVKSREWTSPDGGVVGRLTGQKESDINLAVSRRLQTELENAGLRVVQTRPTEAGLYGVSTSGYKKRDMQKRAQIIRDSVPAAVISVHQNFFSLSSRRGAQVFYRAGSEASYLLACAVQTELNGMEECVRSVQPLTGDYYILNCSEFPSVIVECGFLSNAQDEALLTDGDYQTKLAQTICRGALTFLAAGADAGR